MTHLTFPTTTPHASGNPTGTSPYQGAAVTVPIDYRTLADMRPSMRPSPPTPQMHPSYPQPQPQPQVRYVLNVPHVALTAAALAVACSLAILPKTNALAMDPSPTGQDERPAEPADGTGMSTDGVLVPVDVGADACEPKYEANTTKVPDPSKWDDLCYFQGDPRWGSETFQTGSIADTGCGLCATAHALTILLDEEITPDELADRFRDYSDSVGGIDYGSCGVVWAGWEEVLDGTYGDRVEIGRTDCTPEAVREALLDGKMVILNPPAGAPLKLTDGTMFTIGGGHVVMCYKYENGMFCEKDSGYQPAGHGDASRIEYTEDEFEQVMAGCGSHLGYVYTIGLRA